MSQGERHRPLHELLSREMVDIYVGSENTHWVLHEKLLCHRSRFFRAIFYKRNGRKDHTYGLPDEDDTAFKLFVGWLYSENIPTPREESDLTPLLDVYLMAEKWEIKSLLGEVVNAVRQFYQDSNTWPSLRRVQYIYANTASVDAPMRQLFVSCVARMLVLGSSAEVPPHWETALRKNGQLAVDIILAVKQWHLEPQAVPDARDKNMMAVVEDPLDSQKYDVDEEEEYEQLDWGNDLAPPKQQGSSHHSSKMSSDSHMEKEVK